MTIQMKYYVDSNGKYLGAFNVAPTNATEVMNPPVDAAQVYSNGMWSDPFYTWEQVRIKRDELLRQTDWAMLADSPNNTQGLRSYRQALRNLPQNFASPELVVWPMSPLAQGGES